MEKYVEFVAKDSIKSLFFFLFLLTKKTKDHPLDQKITHVTDQNEDHITTNCHHSDSISLTQFWGTKKRQ